ncbi:unnamed protein product [Peniophora sp. CBMAI 1063]|nr:unnamed protein product [Peniophora sp. CBMAI 1063]
MDTGIVELCGWLLSNLGQLVYTVWQDSLNIVVRASAGGAMGFFMSRWHTWIPRPRLSIVTVLMASVIIWSSVTRSAVSISLRGRPPASVLVLSPFGLHSAVSPALSQTDGTYTRIDQILEVLERHERAIHLFNLDNVAKPDFALYSAGARVYPSATSATRRPTSREHRPELWPSGAAMALHHETHAGYCWQFSGRQGRLGIELSQRVYVEEVTIEHAPAALSSDQTSAPRHMSLWGLVEGMENVQRAIAWQERGRLLGLRKHFALELDDYPDDVQRLLRSARWVPISTFEYDPEATSAIQTFRVDDDVAELGVAFGTVMLLIHDNWGRDDFTCLYRIRVHGRPLAGM